MALLHIYDSSDSKIVQTAEKRGGDHHLVPIDDGNKFVSTLDGLLKEGNAYDRVLFETHGSPGKIYFGNVYIDTDYMAGLAARLYSRLTTQNARVYFNGCNVAEGSAGWSFLEAAVKVFLTPGGGQVFGQTSVGFGNPFNGHVVHLWGDTKTLFVDISGRVTERFEQ
jgi:hypothetical protein